MAQIVDLVAPELGAHRLGHAERVDVEDAAANAELRHVLDHRHALEADRLEMRRELAQPMRVALPQLDAQILERARHARLLEQRARGGDEHAQLAARELLERLDALARDLHVRLGFAESFARRIERERRVVDQRPQIGEPALRFGDSLRGDDEESRRKTARERGDEHGIGRTGKSAGDEALAGCGQCVDDPLERTEPFDAIEKSV